MDAIPPLHGKPGRPRCRPVCVLGDRGYDAAAPHCGRSGFWAVRCLSFAVCYPLSELSVIRHEPDNRFLECALAANAEFILTVNTAPRHFDRKQYQAVTVVRPGEFLNVAEVGRFVKSPDREATELAGLRVVAIRDPTHRRRTIFHAKLRRESIRCGHAA